MHYAFTHLCIRTFPLTKKPAGIIQRVFLLPFKLKSYLDKIIFIACDVSPVSILQK